MAQASRHMRMSRRALLLVALIVIVSVLVGVVGWTTVNELVGKRLPGTDIRVPEKSFGAPPDDFSKKASPRGEP